MDNNGNTLVVEQIFRETLHDETVKVYNFKVEDHHTYYVGENSILVHNAEDYIKANRVPLDKETVLSDKSKYTKINRRFPEAKGANVYRGKDGNYYYRDTLHAGKSAHLEVFNKTGKHIGEADVKTGIIDYSKADPTKRLNVK